ncbi:MAG: lipase secretion chaperone [Alcanivorax sp.]|uniref:lipase secretion chaperone n=1 Tax=Alcanivorax sp. TaxID=1872427 RepID=UPI003DA6E38E
MEKRYLVGVLLLLSMAAVLIWGVPGASDRNSQPHSAADADHTGLEQPAEPGLTGSTRYDHYRQRAQALGPAPASLVGTQVDGNLQVTADGDLLINPAIRQVFDYFLTALGQESLDDIRARLAGHLADQLPPKAAQQAWKLYEQYMGLREAMEQLPEHDGSVAAMRAAIRQRHDMQQACLGPEVADAFYGLDMTYDRYMIERQALLEDEGLAAEQRDRQLTNLEQNLPQGMQKMLNDTRAPVWLEQRTQALREQGASAAEIRALREQTFGAQAVERFEALEQQRQDWEERYGEYRKQRQQLINSGLSHTDQQVALARLQQQLFEDKELARVQALDRINTQTR